MQLIGEMEFEFLNKELEKRCLEEKGLAQTYVDGECIRFMKKYSPYKNGTLYESSLKNTVIGSGLIVQDTPYARYQYYGKLYVDPITKKGAFHDPKTGRFWSRPGVTKIPTERDLKYDQSRSPLAGSHWFERMVKDHSEDIGKGLAKVCGGTYKK